MWFGKIAMLFSNYFIVLPVDLSKNRIGSKNSRFLYAFMLMYVFQQLNTIFLNLRVIFLVCIAYLYA
jgi:hypothetical protein